MTLGYRAQRGGGVVLIARYVPGNGVPGTATFSRPSPATFTNNNGTLGRVGIGAMRESHYINGVRTLLLEPTATNLLPQSKPSAAGWVTYLSLAQGAQPDAFGDAGAAERVNSNTVNVDAAYYYSLAAALANGFYTGSFYLRGAPGTGASWARVMVDNGAVANNSPDQPYSDAAWTRLVFSTVVSYKNAGLRNTGAHTNFPSTDMGNVQVEATTFATSLIETAGAAQTRQADSLTFPQSGTLYEKYYDDAGVLQETVRAYIAGTNMAPARPRGYVAIKLGLGAHSLTEMRNA